MARLHFGYQNIPQMDSQVVTTLASFSLDLTKSRCGIPYIFPRKQVSQPFQSYHPIYSNHYSLDSFLAEKMGYMM